MNARHPNRENETATMNTQHTVRTGITAIICGAGLLAAPLSVGAANRPSPTINTRHSPTIAVNTPTWFPYPCPAADNVPLCNLHHTTRHHIIRHTPASTQASGAINVGHVTPSAQ
jgi:hypothetical protein